MIGVGEGEKYGVSVVGLGGDYQSWHLPKIVPSKADQLATRNIIHP